VVLEPPPILPSRKFSNSVTLGAGEVQSLGEVISDVVTALAGMEPEIEVRISIKAKEGQDYAAANEILERLKPSWRL
jgi:hypothetical protein